MQYVEEDASQTECAISGERFERFYDPDTDKWFYEDATILIGDDAARWVGRKRWQATLFCGNVLHSVLC